MYPLLASQNQLNTKNVCNDTYLPCIYDHNIISFKRKSYHALYKKHYQNHCSAPLLKLLERSDLKCK